MWNIHFKISLIKTVIITNTDTCNWLWDYSLLFSGNTPIRSKKYAWIKRVRNFSAVNERRIKRFYLFSRGRVVTSWISVLHARILKSGDGVWNVGRLTDMLPYDGLILNYHRGRESRLFFGFFSSRAHVRVSHGSREELRRRVYVDLRRSWGSRYILSRKRRCIKRVRVRARCFLPPVIRVPRERALFHFTHWPPAKRGPGLGSSGIASGTSSSFVAECFGIWMSV